jgi:fucose permease
LQFSFCLIGFGGGVLNGGTNALAADITQAGKGAALSLLGVFYGIGALAMPLLIGILTRIISYETLISIIGVLVLIPLVFFMLVKFPEPKQKQGMPLTKAFSLLKEPLLILLGSILFFESALEGIVGNWTTTYLKSVGLSAQHALYALSVHVAAIVVMRLLLSGLLKKITSRIVMYVSFVLILAGSLILTFTTSFSLAMLAMLSLGGGFAAGFPVILGYVGELYPKLSGTAFSIVMVLALIGNASLNYLMGLMSKAVGIHSFPGYLMACLVFMVFLFSIVRKKISTRIKV